MHRAQSRCKMQFHVAVYGIFARLVVPILWTIHTISGPFTGKDRIIHTEMCEYSHISIHTTRAQNGSNRSYRHSCILGFDLGAF